MMSRRRRERARRGLHPIWRGIGCLLAIAIPLVSWFLANGIVDWLITNNPDWTRDFYAANPGVTSSLYFRIGATALTAVILYLFMGLLAGIISYIWGKEEDYGEEERTYTNYRSKR